jgi:3-phosphoshikimate 1-carboxyvinyltransferase
MTATVRPPGSKSLTNRALVCAALADGTSTIRNASDSDDTRLLVAALRGLGFSIEEDPLRVRGEGGRIPAATGRFAMGNAGTSLRFLTALCTLGEGPYEIDGDERMRRRPIGPLVDALVALGARAEYAGAAGCPPVRVQGRLRGGRCALRGDVSSQFLSALLLVAPRATEPLEVAVDGPLVSEPYAEMTRDVLAAFGVRVRRAAAVWHVEPQTPRACAYDVEPDAASANYFAAWAAIARRSVAIEGIRASSRQPELTFLDALAAMGARVERAQDRILVEGADLHGGSFVATAWPDSAVMLAVVALFASGPTEIRGVAHLRHKESDRLAALAAELAKAGARADVLEDGLRITPPPRLRPAEVETYADHRIAMAFGVAGTVVSGLVVRDPSCVRKSFPRFWDALAAVVDRTAQ